MSSQSRKIMLSRQDLIIKKALNVSDKKNIQLAMIALQNTMHPQTICGEYAVGGKRSPMGVLMECCGWDGGAAALYERGKIFVMSDMESITYYRQKVSEQLSPYIVKRIDYLTIHLHYNFEQVMQWLDLLVD